MEQDKELTDYELGRIDATRDILKEWLKFQYSINGRQPYMFDRRDIIDPGVKGLIDDKFFPRGSADAQDD